MYSCKFKPEEIVFETGLQCINRVSYVYVCFLRCLRNSNGALPDPITPKTWVMVTVDLMHIFYSDYHDCSVKLKLIAFFPKIVVYFVFRLPYVISRASLTRPTMKLTTEL